MPDWLLESSFRRYFVCSELPPAAPSENAKSALNYGPMHTLSRRRLLEATLLAPAAGLLGCQQGSHAVPASTRSDVRAVSLVLDALPTLEGAGVHLRRSIGTRQLSVLDPFLLLDEIRSDRVEDYIKGFPTHPHRGFETVTIMLSGAIEHKDSVGNHGRLMGGSAQWMTAGHGIVHSEMPQQDGELFWGLQLWVNLPRTDKLIRPRYQDIPSDRIVELSAAGAPTRVIAGELLGQRGPVQGIAVAPTLMDVRLRSAGRFELEIPQTHGGFVYLLEGSALVGSDATAVRAGQLAALGPGRVVTLRSDAGARVLLAAGRRLDEPVARRGPFVMNTEAELDQAYEDYRSGALVSG